MRGDYTQNTYITRYHQISDSLFDASASVDLAYIVTVNPQNGNRNEKIQDVIIERNQVIANPGGMTMLNLTASDVTVRNNLFNATLIATEPVITITYGNNSAGLPAPERNHIYNNTMFSDSTNGVTGVIVYNAGLAVIDTVIKNNFMYAPNCTHDGANNGHAANFMYDFETNTQASNNSRDSQVKSVSPNLAAIPPVTPDNWSLTNGCYGIDAGSAVPVWSDFFSKSLSTASPRNLGAITK